jgi:hypothetical protein
MFAICSTWISRFWVTVKRRDFSPAIKRNSMSLLPECHRMACHSFLSARIAPEQINHSISMIGPLFGHRKAASRHVSDTSRRAPHDPLLPE